MGVGFGRRSFLVWLWHQGHSYLGVAVLPNRVGLPIAPAWFSSIISNFCPERFVPSRGFCSYGSETRRIGCLHCTVMLGSH